MFSETHKRYKWSGVKEMWHARFRGSGASPESAAGQAPEAGTETLASLTEKARGIHAELRVITEVIQKEVDPPVVGLRPIREVDPSGDHQQAGRLAFELMSEIKAGVQGQSLTAEDLSGFESRLSQIKMLMERNS